MNLINLHNFEKNKKYIHENKCQIIGQGLCHSWDVLLSGNGYNKYIFKVGYNGKEYNIYINECNIIDWRVRTKFEEENEEIENIDFSAHCNFNNQGYYDIYSWNCDDYNHLYINGHKLKILDIDITNDHLDVPLITDIYDDYKRIEHYKDKYSNTTTDIHHEVNMNHLEEISFNKFTKNFTIGKRYYLHSCHGDVVPFDLLELNIVDDCECNALATIYETECSFKTTMRMIFYPDLECTEISVEFKIMSEVFGDVYWDFDDDCHIRG